jgi:hypothetical protein
MATYDVTADTTYVYVIKETNGLMYHDLTHHDYHDINGSWPDMLSHDVTTKCIMAASHKHHITWWKSWPTWHNRVWHDSTWHNVWTIHISLDDAYRNHDRHHCLARYDHWHRVWTMTEYSPVLPGIEKDIVTWYSMIRRIIIERQGKFNVMWPDATLHVIGLRRGADSLHMLISITPISYQSPEHGPHFIAEEADYDIVWYQFTKQNQSGENKNNLV